MDKKEDRLTLRETDKHFLSVEICASGQRIFYL